MIYPELTVFHKFIKKALLYTSRAFEYFQEKFI